MKASAHFIVAVLLCLMFPQIVVHAQKDRAPHRNGMEWSRYDFPLYGDVDSIICRCISVNPDTGKEYHEPSEDYVITFNKNGDVVYISLCIDELYTDEICPAERRFWYNDMGLNTAIDHVMDFGVGDLIYDTYYTYDPDNSRRLKGEIYDEDEKLTGIENYVYDNDGHLLKKEICSSDGELSEEIIYDPHMNITQINEYFKGRLSGMTSNVYDECGRLLLSTVCTADPSDKMKIRHTDTYEYDERGCLVSKERKMPLLVLLPGHQGLSSREYTYRWEYESDLSGNIIKETYYSDSASIPLMIKYYIIVYLTK